MARVARFATLLALSASCRKPSEGPDPVTDPGPTDPPSTPAPPPPTTDTDTDTAPPTDPSAAVFDPTHVVEVQIDLDPDDWATLRAQANDPLALLGGDCMAGPKTTVFTDFPASLTVDGAAFTVAVRKKGFLGSSSAYKPSLKVHLDTYVADQAWNGVDELTLNNNVQDVALIRTCLAYEVFAGAGVPAPRCNFAHVVVNGEDLGVYTNVESVGRAMLGRWFTDPEGHLYEGQVSDLAAAWVNTYETKSDGGSDRADLAAAVAALEVPDAELVASAGSVVDLDAFYRFWVAEHLVAHWDGFTNGLNNHFLYADPATGLFHAIPWGADYTFHAEDLYLGEDRPPSVSANAHLAHRLYALPDQQLRYVDTLTELLATAWDEGALAAEIDRMEALLAPVADPADGRWAAEVDAVRAYVADRRAALEADIAGGPAAWPYPVEEPTCIADGGSVTATFRTTWDSLGVGNPFATGLSEVSVDAPGVLTGTSVAGGAAAGDAPISGFGYRHNLQLLAAFPDGSLQMVYVLVAPDALVPGPAPLDWQSVFAILGAVDPATGGFGNSGYVGSGTLTFDEVGAISGDAVSGTIDGRLLVDVPAP